MNCVTTFTTTFGFFGVEELVSGNFYDWGFYFGVGFGWNFLFCEMRWGGNDVAQ